MTLKRTKDKGNKAEREAVHLLEQDGWEVWRPSPGMWAKAKDIWGVGDIIAFRGEELLIAQVKCNDKPRAIKVMMEKKLPKAFKKLAVVRYDGCGARLPRWEFIHVTYDGEVIVEREFSTNEIREYDGVQRQTPRASVTAPEEVQHRHKPKPAQNSEPTHKSEDPATAVGRCEDCIHCGVVVDDSLDDRLKKHCPEDYLFDKPDDVHCKNFVKKEA